jgi:hypothetical protein
MLVTLASTLCCAGPSAPRASGGGAVPVYLVRITCSSRPAAQALLDDRSIDTGDTGGLKDLGAGGWSVDAVISAERIPAMRARPGVTRIDVLQDVEANRRQRMQELQGKSPFQ